MEVARTVARTIEWQRGWNATRALIREPQRTELAFEIIDALAGRSFDRSFERFCAHPEGRRLLAERPSLLATLSDRATLRALPEGAFGRAYAGFMDTASLSAAGLAEAEAIADARLQRQPADADREFFAARTRDMHDLWHVLTGYGMDEAGEAANLAFSLGQTPNLGMALIVGAGAVIGPKDLSFSWQRYLLQAWQRGRRATQLSVIPYERLLASPLDEVRQLLQIQPAEQAHAHGIIVGNLPNHPELPGFSTGCGRGQTSTTTPRQNAM